MIHTDIGLGIAVHKVQVSAADLTGNFFQIEVCCLGSIRTYSQTISNIGGVAGQVHNRAVGHLHTQFVSGSIYRLGNQSSITRRLAGLGIGGFRIGSFYFLHLAKPGAELRNTDEGGIGNIGSQRRRNCVIGAECTQIPLRAHSSCINILVLQIQLPNSMRTAGLQNGVDLGGIRVAGNNIQVSLGVAVHKVDVIAALGLLQIDIDHIGDGICSTIVPACHLAAECKERLAI